MMKSGEIAVIELGNTHQECIYTQLLFLKKAGFRIHLIVSKKLFSLINYEHMWDNLYLHNVDGSASIFELFKISRYLKKNNIKKVIFNTAENAVVRNFLFLIPGVTCHGILHDVSKLKSSRNQQFINRRIKKYFILNDYLINSIPVESKDKVKSFYPIFFPEMPDNRPPFEKNNEIIIVIPGQLELKRRDYIGLIESVATVKLERIKFILLGNSCKADGKLIENMIISKKLNDQFVFFKEYLPEDEFHFRIKTADIVMPLIHPVHPDSSNYLVQNISGAFNFAFGYKKPLLIHEAFSEIDDFQESSIFYNMSNLVSKLKNLGDHPEQISQVTDRLLAYPKFSFDFQYKKFIESL